MASIPKLTYFPLPGRAESTRLCFIASGKPYENVVIDRTSWPDLKPKTPFGQVPILEHDGKILAQSGAIVRYAAKLTGLFPEDPWEAALADQAWFQAADAWEPFGATMRLPDDEKVKARQELLAGKVGEKMAGIEKLLEGKEYVTGKLSYADLELYSFASTMQAGFLDGVPKDCLTPYPNLRALRNRVASLEHVKAFYANETDGIRSAFRPDA